MNDYKKILTVFVQTVTFLLAAFGWFLRKVAPPSQVGAFYPVGVLSFFMLILLMIIAGLSGRGAANPTSYKAWLIAGIVLSLLAVPAVFFYPSFINEFTYPPNEELAVRKISAPDRYLTREAFNYKEANHPTPTVEELDRSFPDGGVWTSQGIEYAQFRLLASYAWLVLSLSGAIFCLLEAMPARNGVR